MASPSSAPRNLLFAFFAILFSSQSLYLIFTNSLTNDEPYEITSGYFYWTKGDVVAPRINPPVAAALQTLPLLSLPLQTRSTYANWDERAYDLFFNDNLRFLKQMTVLPRLVNLMAGLAMGFLLFLWTRKKSWAFQASVLALWALSPTLIAHTSLAKSDAMAAFFYLASVLAYLDSMERPDRKNFILAGLLTGAAVTSKVTALSLGLLYMLLELQKALAPGARKGGPFRDAGAVFKRWAWVGSGSVAWAALVYLPGTLLLREHRFPLTYYFDRISEGWRMPQKGWAYFTFLGRSSDEGSLFYLPLTFLLKTPAPLLVLLALGLLLWAFRKIKMEPVEWIAPLTVLVCVLPGSSIGVRLLLPAFPFLFLFSARAADWMWNGSERRFRGTARWIIQGLGLWLVLSLASQFPHYLSYANESLDPERKPYFFANGDLDWGQDHLRVCRTARERGWKEVKLALFAGADPHFYGLDWKPWTEKDLRGPQPGQVYLIDASFFQLAPVYQPRTGAIAQGWISERAPTGKVGDTWWYYEIPGVPQADDSPKLPSVPGARYYWNGPSRVPL